MEHAQWRGHRGHFIIERRSGLLRRKRYDVSNGNETLASFRDPIRAEIYIDQLTRQPAAGRRADRGPASPG